MIKAIIFDLGGVILTHKSEVTLVTLADLFKIDNKRFMSVFKKYEDEWVTGKISARELVAKFKGTFKSNQSTTTITKHWKEIYRKRTRVNKQLLSLIAKLRRKYKVYLLTNTTDIHHSLNAKRRIFNHFDKVFASFIVGKRKPNKDFYQHLLDEINLKPQQCVFIDDRLENIKAARRLRMKTILFRDNKNLIDRLKKLEIKI